MIFTACENERCEEFNLLNFDIIHEEKHFHYSSHYQKRDTNSKITFHVLVILQGFETTRLIRFNKLSNLF